MNTMRTMNYDYGLTMTIVIKAMVNDQVLNRTEMVPRGPSSGIDSAHAQTALDRASAQSRELAL